MTYCEFADKLRRVILPDIPMTSHGEWKTHRMEVDRLHLFLLIRLKSLFIDYTLNMGEGLNGDLAQQLYSKMLEFFSERFSERGMVNPPSRISPPSDVALNWATKGQLYLNCQALFYSHHFIRLKNGASVNFVVVPTGEGLPRSADQIKGRRYRLYDRSTDTDGSCDGKPLSPIEEWDDDLYVFFQYTNDKTKTAQGKYNDTIELAVKNFVGNGRKYAELFKRLRTGKNLFRNELNKFTKRLRPGEHEKFLHRDLGRFLNEELMEFIKSRIIDIDSLVKNQ